MRFLYIALAAALLGLAGRGTAAAQDVCTTAPDASVCLDDGDPCTLDRCQAGVCLHADVPNRPSCDPLVDIYRRTLGLGSLVTELATQTAGATLPETAHVLVLDALGATAAALVRTSDVLAGRITIPEPAAGETLALARSRAALGIARGTPTRVRSVMRLLAVPAVRAAGGPSVVDLARRARFLYRSTNQLNRDLRRLQRVSGVFAR